MRKFFGSLLFLIISSLTLALVLGFFVLSNVLHPQAILDSLSSSGAYTVVTEQVSSSLEQMQQLEPNASEAPFELADIITAAISPSWMERQVESTALTLTAWMMGSQQDIHLPLNIAEPRQAAANAAIDKLRAQFAALPTCSAREAATLLRDLQRGSADINCLPAGTSVEEALDAAKPQIDQALEFLEQLPDTVDLVSLGGYIIAAQEASVGIGDKQQIDEKQMVERELDLLHLDEDERVVAGRGEIMRRLYDARQALQSARRILRALVLVDLVLALALLALLWRTPRALLRTLAGVIFSDGLALLLLGGLGAFAGQTAVQTLQVDGTTSAALRDFLQQGVPQIINLVLADLRWWGSIGLIVGIAAFAASFLLPQIFGKKKNTSPQKTVR